jgi:hypothetical protein
MKYNVVIVGSDGKPISEELIVIPEPTRRRPLRRFNEELWSIADSKRWLKRYLFRQDREGLDAVFRALDRLDCWSEALRSLRVNRPTQRHAEIITSFWIEHGLSFVPMGLRGDTCEVMVDLFRHFLKPYDGPEVTLYRGELQSRFQQGICGVAWTTNIRMANTFAVRRVPFSGVLLKLEATPDLIVADLKRYSNHTTNIGEDEYIVDPRLILNKITVVESEQ